MNEDRKFNFQAILKTFSDEDVLTLHSLVYSEVQVRIQKKVDSGNYPDLIETEKELCLNGSPISAIQCYRSRTGIDDLLVVKKIVENFRAANK